MRRVATTPFGWTTGTIASRLSSVFPGEWGSDPTPGKEVASVLRSTNLDDFGHVDLGTGADRHIPQIKLATKELRPGDILLEASGGGPGKPVGRVALFKGGARRHICSNFFRTLRPNSQIHSGYLAWRLLHLYESPGIWNYQQQTTGLINLNLREYLGQDLAWPPLNEQARIAEVLDTLDEAIRRSELVCDKRGQLLQGVAQRLMTRGVDEAGRVRDPERFPEKFKSTVLGRFPGSWQIKPLRDLGMTITGSTPPSSVPGVWGDGLPFVTPSEVTEGGAVLPSSRFVTEKGRPFVSPLPPGTLLTICIGSTLGKMALLHHECATNQQINATIPGPGIDGTFLEHAIRLQMGRLLAMAGLQAVPIVNRTQFESLTVAVAPPEEQERIGEIIRSQQALIHEEETVLARLRAIKTGLATDLLNGRVRVSTGATG